MNRTIVLMVLVCLFVNISYAQKSKVLPIINATILEPLVGAKLTNEYISLSDMDGEITLDSLQEQNDLFRLEMTGYVSELINLNTFSEDHIFMKPLDSSIFPRTHSSKPFNKNQRIKQGELDTNRIEEMWGCWEVSGDCAPRSGYYFMHDTLIIHNNYFCESATAELHRYEIVNDTIITQELESYTIDTNVGLVLTHYKNRLVERRIPLCWFKQTGNCLPGLTTKYMTLYGELRKVLDQDFNGNKFELIDANCQKKWLNIEDTEVYRRTKEVFHRTIETN